MKKLTLKAKIYYLIAVFLISFAANVLLLLYEFSARSRQDREFATLRMTLQKHALLSQLSLKQEVQAWTDLLLRGGDSGQFQKHKDEFFQSEAQVQVNMQSLGADAPDPEIKAKVEEFLIVHAQIGREYRSALEQSRRRNSPAANRLVMDQGRDASATLDEIIQELELNTSRYQNAQQRSLQAQLHLNGMGALLFIAVLFIAGMYVARTVTRATDTLISHLSAQSSDLQKGHGDLTKLLMPHRGTNSERSPDRLTRSQRPCRRLSCNCPTTASSWPARANRSPAVPANRQKGRASSSIRPRRLRLLCRKCLRPWPRYRKIPTAPPMTPDKLQIPLATVALSLTRLWRK